MEGYEGIGWLQEGVNRAAGWALALHGAERRDGRLIVIGGGKPGKDRARLAWVEGKHSTAIAAIVSVLLA